MKDGILKVTLENIIFNLEGVSKKFIIKTLSKDIKTLKVIRRNIENK